jgi:hypothetical protein
MPNFDISQKFLVIIICDLLDAVIGSDYIV